MVTHLQFSGMNYIHDLVQSSLLSISKTWLPPQAETL